MRHGWLLLLLSTGCVWNNPRCPVEWRDSVTQEKTMNRYGKAAAKLREARELIKRGWTRESLCGERNGAACYCAAGAIIDVHTPEDPVHTPRDPNETTAFWLLMEQIPEEFHTDKTFRSESPEELSDVHGWKEVIFNWNDHDGRTQQEVLDAFDAAIALGEKLGADA